MHTFQRSVFHNKKGWYGDFKTFFDAHRFEVGGGWEYDHGFMDRILKSSPYYLFLRMPVYVEEGTFGNEDAKVRLGEPFLLRHQFEEGLDEQAVSGALVTPLINQFSEPKDADANLSDDDILLGQEALSDLEIAFKQHFRPVQH